MLIKVNGRGTAKELVLVLMKALADNGIESANGCSLYIGGGNERIEVSAGQNREIPTYQPQALSRGGKISKAPSSRSDSDCPF
jgi:hypothetical protein